MSTRVSKEGIFFEVQNICHVPLFTLLFHKKSCYFNVVFILISFKHEGSTLKVERKVNYIKIY